MKNEIQRNYEQIGEAFAVEILKAQTRFIHICLAAILPKELYDLAAADNQIQRCEKWAKEQGYYWEGKIGEHGGELLLKKGPIVVARFQPVLQGEKDKCRCVFYANVLGKHVNVADGNPLLN